MQRYESGWTCSQACQRCRFRQAPRGPARRGVAGRTDGGFYGQSRPGLVLPSVFLGTPLQGGFDLGGRLPTALPWVGRRNAPSVRPKGDAQTQADQAGDNQIARPHQNGTPPRHGRLTGVLCWQPLATPCAPSLHLRDGAAEALPFPGLAQATRCANRYESRLCNVSFNSLRCTIRSTKPWSRRNSAV